MVARGTLRGPRFSASGLPRAGLHPRTKPKRGRVFRITDPKDEGAGPFQIPPAWPLLALVGFIGLGLLVGAADGGLTAHAIGSWYAALTQPPGTPPNTVFGPVWGALYVLMGVAAWRVWRRAGPGRALRLWGWQLAANAAWAPVFFSLHAPWAALGVLVVLIALIGATIRRFAAIDRAAAGLMVPYLLWSGYALYLNAGIAWLNRG